jgi:NAD(P)-dependent dehydrogenase (short-subunit alcohol dehydrogenase family)
MSGNPLIVILGSGPGIGTATGALYASKGWNVALLRRSADGLKEDSANCEKVAKSNVKVKSYAVDLGDHKKLFEVLANVEKDLGTPEVVLYNAARIANSRIGETDPEFVLEDFKVSLSVPLPTTIN